MQQEQNTVIPPKIREYGRSVILSNLRKYLAGQDGIWIFRHFSDNLTAFPPKKITKNIDHNVSILVEKLSDLSVTDIDRYAEFTYKSFYGLTSVDCIRDNEPDCIKGKKIFVHSQNYAEIDLLEFGPHFATKVKPVAPIKGDLLCLFISNKNAAFTAPNPQYVKLSADAWFIASEQYLRTWTAIMYDWHETFHQTIPKKNRDLPQNQKEEIVRKKLFCGNRLMTNSWLKYKLAANNFTKEQSMERYWHLRTETASRKWVDVYTVMVLIARYGELPCHLNLPNYAGGDIKRTKWHFPPQYVSKFVTVMSGKESLHNMIELESSFWNPYREKLALLKSVHAVLDTVHLLGQSLAPESTKEPQETDKSRQTHLTNGNAVWLNVVKGKIQPTEKPGTVEFAIQKNAHENVQETLQQTGAITVELKICDNSTNKQCTFTASITNIEKSPRLPTVCNWADVVDNAEDSM